VAQKRKPLSRIILNRINTRLDFSSFVVFQAAIRVKSTHMIKIIMLENQKKKRKYGNKIHFYIDLYLKDSLDIEFTAC